jgi:protease PrsW
MRAGRSLAGLGLLAALGLAASAATFGTSAFVFATAVAVIPVPIYVAMALWIDRFEPEPRAMLAMAFLWGASVAILVAGLLNGVADGVLGEYWSTVASAPLFEEALKGYILIRFYRKRKDEFDGVIDGIVYAAMVGLGFAFAENVDYFGRALVKEGVGGLAVTFTLRDILSPFSHPLFTSMTGIGLGVARQTSRTWARWFAPPAGFAGALLLHGMWNAGASAGLWFFGVYFFIMVPALLTLLAIAGVALKSEGKVIRTHLAGEALAGWLSPDELARLCSVRGRLHASAAAFRRGGFRGWRDRRRFHRAASELAFLRRRALHDGVARDAALEYAYLRTLGAPEPAPEPETPQPPAPAPPA